MSLIELQNGLDIRGITIDSFQEIKANLIPIISQKIGLAFSKWILNKEDKDFSDLIKDLQEPIESKEIRIKITESDFKKYGEYIINNLKLFVQNQPVWEPNKVNFEGLWVSCDPENGNGWFLLRMSLHDPVLPLNIESGSDGRTDKIILKLKPFLKKYNYLKNPALI